MSDIDIDALIEDLNGDESARKKAVFKLGEKKVVKAIQPMLALFERETIQVIRRNIISAFGKIKNEEAVSPLCQALFDADFYVKQIAARSLGKIKDKRAVEPLLRLIKGGGAKVYTLDGAGHQVDDSNSKSEVLQQDGIKYLGAQINAIKALGLIGESKAVGPLINEFDDSEGAIRCAIAIALGKIGSPEAVPALMSKLTDAMWYVRRDAAIALGNIKDVRATDGLIEILNDKYDEAAENSAKAIEKIGEVAIAKAFLLKPKNVHVQQMVKRNFKSKKEIVSAILKAAETEQDPEKREKLITSIKKMMR